MKSASIFRQPDDGKETQGTIVYGEHTDCTLERPWKDNQHGISCIPANTYLCVWAYMPSHKKWHYQITDVPDRDAVFIHSVNFVGDLRGCVAVGTEPRDINADGEIDLAGSRVALDRLEKYMRDENGNQENFMLTIVNPPSA